MVVLTPLAPVVVSFAGGRTAQGPLTCGQLSTVDWLSAVTESDDAHLELPLDIPAGATVADVTTALAVLLVRHESLRTVYVPANPSRDELRRGVYPMQVTLAAGELAVDRYAADDDAVDSSVLVAELIAKLREGPPQAADALSVRMALVTTSGTVRAGVLTCSHMAVDHHAMLVLRREFAEMVRDPAVRRPGAPRYQPLDRAHAEHGAVMRRRAEITMRYLEDRLVRMPQCLYARPRLAPPEGSMAVQLVSAAAAMAVQNVVVRTRMTRPAVVFAAVCALLSHRTGYRACEFPIMAGNRHERELVDYVGTLAQTTIVTVEVGSASFDELVQRAFAATLNANRRGCHDVFRRATLTDRIEWERGVSFNFGPVFNNVAIESARGAHAATAVTPEQLAAAPPAKLHWRPMPPSTPVLRFDLWQLERVLRLRLYSGDAGRVDRAEVKSLLLALERLLVAAAAGDLDHERMREAIGLAPIPREAGWRLVDSCWVELAEVQRLLDDALAPAVARVFPTVDGEELVAYLAGGTITTVTEAHARCMAALPGRVTAMAPRRYILCDSAPDRPDRLSAWQLRAVISQGSGRTPDREPAEVP